MHCTRIILVVTLEDIVQLGWGGKARSSGTVGELLQLFREQIKVARTFIQKEMIDSGIYFQGLRES